MEYALFAVTSLLLIAAAFVVFRFFIRRDYLQRDRLSPFTSALQVLLFFLHALSAYIFMDVRWRNLHQGNPTYPLAVVLIIVGLALLLIISINFGYGQAFGVRVTGLKTTGFYRFTRNPQILAGSLFYIGWAFLWPSWGGIIWIGLLWILFHIMILTEEEHLRNAFGEEYERYCRKTPRYIGIPKQ